MPTVSVITPAFEPQADYLLAAYESLRAQEIPAGWDWEWVVQEDGSTGALERILPADPRISFGTGRRGGVALTRNLALARSRGELVKNLDSDDILTPGVLARDIEVLAADPEVQWTTSRVLDLLPDGTRIGFDSDPPEGRLEPGVVVEHWRSHGYRLPVHPTTVCIRRPLVTALGGWMGVPGSDDSGMLVAASVVSVGYFSAETGLLYRKWPGQVTAEAGHLERAEWNARMSLIDERASAIGALWPNGYSA